MQFIDTHAHLNFDPIFFQVNDVLVRARNAQVRRVVTPAYDLASWAPIAQLARHEMVFAALGLHPWRASEPFDADLLRTRLREHRAVAVGEIGLDFKIAPLDKARQVVVFTEQLDVAAALDLPVILHCRGAFMEMLDALKSYHGKIRGVIHAFSRGPDIADEFLKLGFSIAFGGAVTRPNAKRARKSAMHVPLERMVLETDCPSIGLDGVEPEQAEPMHVAQVAQALSAIRQVPVEEIAAVTTAGAESLFQLA